MLDGNFAGQSIGERCHFLADQKRHAVQALQLLNYNVIAAGDSFNDTAMLCQADTGILIHAPENVIAQFPQLPCVHDHADLLSLIEAKL